MTAPVAPGRSAAGTAPAGTAPVASGRSAGRPRSRSLRGGPGGPVRGWWATVRRHRGLALVVALVLLGAAGLTALTGAGQQVRTPSDPDNPRPNGARALARVLAEHGVQVDVVRSQSELMSTPLGPGTTLLVTSTENLSRSVAAHTAAHARRADRMVLLSPGGDPVEGMRLSVDPSVASVWDPVLAGCATAGLTPELVISGGDRTYRPRRAALGAEQCFTDGAGAVMLTLPATSARPAVTLLGSRQVLANGSVLEADNAAVALRLTGGSPRLVWYVADATDIPADEATSLDSLVPRWVAPGLLLGTSALLALMLWRGRRLGRLVLEPLPAVVSAIETTRSRARMYHKAGDRARAAAVLQSGARARLTAYLGLPRGSDAAALAAAVAAVTGRPLTQVSAALTAPPPDDPSLLALAQQLATLEKEVRRP
jgi:hypothetical protein